MTKPYNCHKTYTLNVTDGERLNIFKKYLTPSFEYAALEKSLISTYAFRSFNLNRIKFFG